MNKNRVGLVTKDVTGGISTIISSFNNFNSKTSKYYVLLLKSDLHGALLKKRLKNIKTTVSLQPSYPIHQGWSIKKVFIVIKNIHIFNKWIENNELDVIILFDFYSYIIGFIYKLFFRNCLKIVLYVNIPIADLLEDKPIILHKSFSIVFKILAQRMVNGFICMTDGLKNYLLKNYKLGNNVLITTVYQGINAGSNYEQKPAYQTTQFDHFNIKKFNILSFGRFTKQKDFITIIQAYKLLSKDLKKKINLHIVGEGPEKKRYTKAADNEPNIYFYPWTNYIGEYLKRSQVFIFSSRFEGFGIAIIEALAAGVPVIATDTNYGPREILENNNYGLLTPVGNIPKMTESIKKMYSDRKMRINYKKLGILRSKYFSLEKQKKAINGFITEIGAQAE